MTVPPFYPVTCHPRLSRRQFLIGAGTFLGASALSHSRAQAGEAGLGIIREYATRPDDPWAVAHGLRAMGKGFTIEGGKRAVDHLLERSLAVIPANGKSALGFPLEVEVHQNMFLKTMLEAGVPLDYRFNREGKRRTLQEVVDGARALFQPKWATSDPNRLPWSIIALTRTTSLMRGRWTNAWGEPVDLDSVVEIAFGRLERASAPIAEAMQQGRPLVAQAPVHAFTCGGTHMLYSLLVAVHEGYLGQNRAERVRQQVNLLVWRLGADVALIDRFYKERAGQSGAFWYDLDSKLKLLGHAEECLAFAETRGVVSLTPTQQAQRRAAVASVRRMLADLQGKGLSPAKALNVELYRQLIGDTCHAYHGLHLA